MGWQLGPKALRKPPRGWLPGQATPLRHVAREPPTSGGPDGGGDGFVTTCRLDVTWRVEVEGREPYEFEETSRTAPGWLMRGVVGGGKRWYKVRVRPSYGLMKEVGVPCFVDPDDLGQLWIDWDAAYEAHVPAWERKARIDRELAKRDNVVSHAVDRVLNPLAGRVRDDEVAEVDALDAERREREAAEFERARVEGEAQLKAMGRGAVEGDDKAEQDRRMAEMTRLTEIGRPATATVVSRQETGRMLGPIPVIDLVLDVDDGGATRRVVYEHIWGARRAKRYKPGRRIDVKIDPDDPDRLTLAS